MNSKSESRNTTMPDIHGTREELVALIGEQYVEIERLRKELADARAKLDNLCTYDTSRVGE